jgi:hypothetical protein
MFFFSNARALPPPARPPCRDPTHPYTRGYSVDNANTEEQEALQVSGKADTALAKPSLWYHTIFPACTGTCIDGACTLLWHTPPPQYHGRQCCYAAGGNPTLDSQNPKVNLARADATRSAGTSTPMNSVHNDLYCRKKHPYGY